MKIILFCLSRGVTTGGRGKVSPTFFQKLEKTVIALTVVILGYISQLKYGFKNFQEKKTQIFSLWSLSFMHGRSNVYRSALIPRKYSCPEKLGLRACLDIGNNKIKSSTEATLVGI